MQQGIRVTARAVITRDKEIVLSEYIDEESAGISTCQVVASTRAKH